MKIATAQQMRELDRITIEDRRVPSTLLMERAASGLLRVCLETLGDPLGKTAVCFCGAGNNGGDGVAVAKMLMSEGVKVRAFLVGRREKMTNDSREMERRLVEFGGELESFDPANVEQKQAVFNADICVDAIFGIGLNSDIRGNALDAIAWMNEAKAQVIAADIASGVESDTGRILGCAVKAAKTVTFTMPKVGHFVGEGGVCCGELIVHSIGIPQEVIDKMEYSTSVIDANLVHSWLPERPETGHKGTFGKAYILAGATGYTGAPVMAASGAMRAGTGLVFMGVPQSIYPIVAVKCDEAMPSPLPDDEQGMLSEDALVPVLEKMAGCDAALIGPGLGRGAGVEKVLMPILETVRYPLVLDADGLNVLSGHLDSLYARRDCPTILTPHDGEFARLGGDLADGDRLTAAQRFAMLFGCLLVLKGHGTIVALPNGEAFINTTGNSGMAKGGSGDVLSGILLSLLAQGMHPVKAAVCAVWVHGRAGDLAAAKYSKRGMTPTDLIEMLPEVWKELEMQA